MGEPIQLGATFAAAMSQVDGCPTQDCLNVEAPDTFTPRALGALLHYRCAECGTTWTTDWKEDL